MAEGYSLVITSCFNMNDYHDYLRSKLPLQYMQPVQVMPTLAEVAEVGCGALFMLFLNTTANEWFIVAAVSAGAGVSPDDMDTGLGAESREAPSESGEWGWFEADGGQMLAPIDEELRGTRARRR